MMLVEGYHKYSGDIMMHEGGYHEYHGGTQITKDLPPTVLMISPMVLSIPHYAHIPYSTEHPYGTQDIPPHSS